MQKPGREVSLASRKQDTARLSMAEFPGRQLGILCFLISSSQRPSAQRLAGALSGRPRGSAWFSIDLPRAPEQRTEQRTDLWVGAKQAWHRLLEICSHAAVRFTSQVSAFCMLGLHQAPLARPVAYSHFSELFHCPGTAALLQFHCRQQNGS